jgi:hypothetical protein
MRRLRPSEIKQAQRFQRDYGPPMYSLLLGRNALPTAARAARNPRRPPRLDRWRGKDV